MDMPAFIETLSFIQFCGLAGFVGYIAGFAGLQFGFLDGNGWVYSLINILAASLVLASLMEQFNLASALIQISWIVIGIAGITLRGLRKRNGSPVHIAVG